MIFILKCFSSQELFSFSFLERPNHPPHSSLAASAPAYGSSHLGVLSTFSWVIYSDLIAFLLYFGYWPYGLYGVWMFSLVHILSFYLVDCFVVGKAFSSKTSHWPGFAFLIVTFGNKSFVAMTVSGRFSPFLPSSDFEVLGFNFKILIHFELVYCMWYQMWFHFHSYACVCQFSLVTFIEETIFL